MYCSNVSSASCLAVTERCWNLPFNFVVLSVIAVLFDSLITPEPILAMEIDPDWKDDFFDPPVHVNLLSRGVALPPSPTGSAMSTTEAPYRLYKRRWIGVFVMVRAILFCPNSRLEDEVHGQFILEAVSAASGPWFGPIANNGTALCLSYPQISLTCLPVVRDFGFNLGEVNWLGNIISCVYVPTAIFTPIITKRYGLRRCVGLMFHLPRVLSHSSRVV